ncbi:hypothetical protein [Nitrobacter hamburgensis]|nr:hypothetical protein [Nitrobacter hamburgensis]
MVKFVESRPFANPESAARKLAEIARELTCAQGWAYTGVTNTAFLRAGGNVAEYGAGIAHGIAYGLFAIDTSGTRITILETLVSCRIEIVEAR